MSWDGSLGTAIWWYRRRAGELRSAEAVVRPMVRGGRAWSRRERELSEIEAALAAAGRDDVVAALRTEAALVSVRDEVDVSVLALARRRVRAFDAELRAAAPPGRSGPTVG